MLKESMSEVARARQRVNSLTCVLSERIFTQLKSAAYQLQGVYSLDCRRWVEGAKDGEFDFFIFEEEVLKSFLDGEYEEISAERVRLLMETFGDVNELIDEVVKFEGVLITALRCELDGLKKAERQLTLAHARLNNDGG